MTARFPDLVMGVRKAIGDALGVDERQEEDEEKKRRRRNYKRVLTTRGPSQLYDAYGISGGTFVVADSHLKQLVLILDAVKEAKDYDLKLNMPILEVPDSSSKAHGLTASSYNDLSNRVFQLYREEQGFRTYGGAFSFSRVPEIFSGLNSRGPTIEEGEYKDWVYIREETISRLICCWRLLWVGIERLGRNASLARLIDSLNSKAAPRSAPGIRGQRRFTTDYFKRLHVRAIAEGWIEDLDELDGQGWAGVANKRSRLAEHGVWQSTRDNLDVVSDEPLCSATRLNKLPGFIKLSDRELREFAASSLEWLRDEESVEHLNLKNRTKLERYLEALHSFPLPIPSYFYYYALDMRPKEHLVLPIMRSWESPVVYYDKRNKCIQTHSVVCACLIALHARDQHRDAQELIELQTILHMAAERMVDSVFVKGLVQTHKTTARRLHNRILRASKPTSPRWPKHSFVLGTFDTRVSFISQQTRAFTLVEALHATGVLKKGSTVGIIGGGVAGVTAASAALLRGYHVALFEKKGNWMSIQAGGKHRYLLPYVLDWPDPGCNETSAVLPALSWDANDAKRVIFDLRQRFGEVKKAFDQSLTVHMPATVKEVFSVGDTVWIVHTGPEQRTPVNVLIVSAGFGTDRPAELPEATPGYWDYKVDQLDRLDPNGNVRQVLVSGNGDGALIDLARAALCLTGDDGKPRAFQHGRAMDRLLNHPRLGDLAVRMQELDETVDAGQLAGGIGANLYEKYHDRFGYVVRRMQQELSSVFSKRLDMQVCFNPPVEGIFRTDTAIIHKVVAFLLLEFGFVTYEAFRLTKDRIRKSGRKWSVVMNNGAEREFDILVLRHGPLPPEERLAGIVNLQEAYRDFEKIRPLDLYSELDKVTFLEYARLAEMHLQGA